MGFDTVHVDLVGGFTFNVNAYAHLLSLLLVYACFLEFIRAEAFLSDALFAVLFGYNWCYVVHLFASFLLFVTVSASVAELVTWT